MYSLFLYSAKCSLFVGKNAAEDSYNCYHWVAGKNPTEVRYNCYQWVFAFGNRFIFIVQASCWRLALHHLDVSLMKGGVGSQSLQNTTFESKRQLKKIQTEVSANQLLTWKGTGFVCRHLNWKEKWRGIKPRSVCLTVANRPEGWWCTGYSNARKVASRMCSQYWHGYCCGMNLKTIKMCLLNKCVF